MNISINYFLELETPKMFNNQPIERNMQDNSGRNNELRHQPSIELPTAKKSKYLTHRNAN